MTDAVAPPPPEPRANPYLFGHADAERQMRDAALAGRLHHAWLIGGALSIGKATLAYRFARALLAGFPGEGLAVGADHPVFRRVARGTHADLAVLERSWDEKRRRTRNEIVADEVRAVGEFLALTPAEGGWRVVIMDGAEHLNRSAANALLKLLEEPPSRAILLLVSPAPGRLLPTIRSRCRTLRLTPLDDGAMTAALVALRPGITRDEAGRLVAEAGGAPGRALEASGASVAIDHAVEAALRRAEVGRGDAPPDRADEALAESLARTEDGFDEFTSRLRVALEARARRSAGADLAAAASCADASLAIGVLREQTTRLNLDKRQAILSALHTIRTR